MWKWRRGVTARLTCREVEQDEDFAGRDRIGFRRRFGVGDRARSRALPSRDPQSAIGADATYEQHTEPGSGPHPSWDEYLAELEIGAGPYAEAARAWVLQQPARILASDEWCDFHTLEFSDGAVLAVGWRAWAQFLSACFDRRESYMKYYCRENFEIWTDT